MSEAWQVAAQAGNIIGMMGAFLGGVSAIYQGKSWIAKQYSPDTYIKDARDIIRTIDEFSKEIQPHEREKILAGQPDFFLLLEKRVKRLRNEVNAIEAHSLQRERSDSRKLRETLRAIIQSLNHTYKDILTTTNRIRQTDSDEEDDDNNTESTDTTRFDRVNRTDLSIPRLPTITPTDPLAFTGESFELPETPRAAHFRDSNTMV